MKKFMTLFSPLVLISNLVWAQSPNQNSISNSSDKSEKSVEKLRVTGSRIKRVDVEGSSPILVIDREALLASGHNSVSDVLRESTSSTFGVKREYSEETNSVGASSIGLRGLGSDRTLVLLDGRRLPKIDGGNSVDLNLIPFDAIERVEILKDGASAIHGSDALGGVINFITKKDKDGGTFRARYSVPEAKGGIKQELNATFGKQWSRGNFLANYQYRNNERVWDRDRPWSSNGLSSYSFPPTIRTRTGSKASQWKASPNCPSDRVAENADGSSSCLFRYSDYTTSLPDTEQHSALAKAEFDLNQSTQVYGMGTYTRRQVRWQWAPSADGFEDGRVFLDGKLITGKDRKIPQNIAQKGGLPGATGDMELRYRAVNELGPRRSIDTTNSFGGVLGVRGAIANTWDWDLFVNHGQTTLFNNRISGYGNSEVFFDSIIAGKISPWKANTNASQIPGLHHVGEQWIRSKVTTAQAISSGELGSFLGSGTLSMAAGVSSAWENYSVEVDSVTANGNLFGGIGENGSGRRDYQSVFSEVSATKGPLEATVAARYDYYSDFGSTFNPKFSLRYQPKRDILFRGSVGTGFRAPSLDQLYSQQKMQYPWFVDTVARPELGPQQHRVFSGGNPDLKEETSVSWNLGTVVQLSKNMSISLDGWSTSIKNAVAMNFQNLILAEQQLGADGLAKHGAVVERAGEGGPIDNIYAPFLNLAQRRVQGLEISTRGIINLKGWRLIPRMDHSHLMTFQEETFPGLGFQNQLEEYGQPRWRNSISLTAQTRRHSLRMAARTISSQFENAHRVDPTQTGRIRAYTEYDLNYALDFNRYGILNFGIKNVFGTDRPIDPNAGHATRLNLSLYDPIGRLAYLGYQAGF